MNPPAAASPLLFTWRPPQRRRRALVVFVAGAAGGGRFRCWSAESAGSRTGAGSRTIDDGAPRVPAVVIPGVVIARVIVWIVVAVVIRIVGVPAMAPLIAYEPRVSRRSCRDDPIRSPASPRRRGRAPRRHRRPPRPPADTAFPIRAAARSGCRACRPRRRGLC